MEPFIGQIMMFGGNFAPRGWALCNGQLLDINSHSALFSILGTTYGGDGRTTFGLPELRGRVAMHAGNGPGLTSRPLGQKSGVEDVVLNQNQIPAHHHTVVDMPVTGTVDFDISKAGTQTPQTVTGGKNDGNVLPHTKVNIDLKANGNTMNTGGSLGHTNIQPFQVVNYIIALEGVYPSRS